MKLYVIQATPKLHKIGVSKHPDRRVAQLSTGCPYPLRLARAEECAELSVLIAERIAHRRLARWRLNGEWFSCTERQAVDTVLAAIIAADAEVQAAATAIVAQRKCPAGQPGAVLAATLQRFGLKAGKAANLLRVSRQSVYSIIAGQQPITPAMALRLGKLFGNGGAYWREIQIEYDIERYRSEMKEIVDQIPTLFAA